MPKLKHYYHYKPNESGYISFVCDQYVVMVVHEKEDKESMNGLRQVKILIYPTEWKQLKHGVMARKKYFKEILLIY